MKWKPKNRKPWGGAVVPMYSVPNVAGWSVSFETTSLEPPPPKPAPALPSETATGLIFAYREWGLVRRYPDGLRLTGAGGTTWPLRQRLDAICLSHPAASDHSAPFHGCHCGIYGLRDGIDLTIEETTPSVVGEVYLWGRVIEAEHGYRAQFAYPKQLAVVNGSPKLAGALEFAYGVRCEVWE